VKRVRVRWHTTEVQDWDAVIEIPDDEEPDDYLNGDSEELVEVEDLVPLEERPADDFTREIDSAEVLP
jgi:hypothetical protein